MTLAIPTFVLLSCVSTAFVAAAWFMSFRLAPESTQPRMQRWLTSWSVKGLGVPLAIWVLMNLGISWSLQPFMPEVQAARSSGEPWVPQFLRVAGQGAFIISSYWAAVTLGWVLFNVGSAADTEPRKDFRALCWACFLGLMAPALLVLVLGGWGALGLAAAVILVPMAGYAPGVLQPKGLPPMYARAIARIKFGKFNEAEWEIIRELEKCQDDFEGWMMLAELYADHYQDLLEAERTVLEICDQPRLTPSQLSIALHRLADWHLKLAQDPDGARRALQMLCDRLKGSHLERMARLRMNQLPKTTHELREQKISRPIPLPALGSSFDQTPSVADSEAGRSQAVREANACVDLLRQDPNSIAEREKLARIFAERLNKPELGIEQLVLLLNLPDPSDARRADWLGLIAAWHIKYRHDIASGRKFLERLVEQFPESPQAFAARHRLESLS